MGVDHGGFDALVAKVFLDLADVYTMQQEMRGKGMSQGVDVGRLYDRSAYDGLMHDSLENLFRHVMPAHRTRPWIDRTFFRWEHVLPTPFKGRFRILHGQCIGQPESFASTARAVLAFGQ